MNFVYDNRHLFRSTNKCEIYNGDNHPSRLSTVEYEKCDKVHGKPNNYVTTHIKGYDDFKKACSEFAWVSLVLNIIYFYLIFNLLLIFVVVVVKDYVSQTGNLIETHNPKADISKEYTDCSKYNKAYINQTFKSRSSKEIFEEAKTNKLQIPKVSLFGSF